MPSFRSVIATLVVFTQVWTPVFAQTLPISVDKSAPGARPVVGVSANGVPIVNIAPPSAAGVSNNRFTQFNVGPSGVVLNNSGASSQSQLAGAVAGNPMLGNSRATTILNQVTANNPSQLRGFMEVAGNRANVIVANPAGILCDGCGFLNANRATLTTGRPMLGPDGGVQGFDVTRGRLSVEGQGLYGDNLDQVDLIARSLAINASVWANRLNVVAGAATVGYGDGSVQSKAGEDAAPAVSLDMAALGSMYANSIRLVGTEAGVGVNIGGNLAAMTGDLQVTAGGDVRILPSGRVQAAGNVDLGANASMSVEGAVASNRDVALRAPGSIGVSGSVGANGNLAVEAGQGMSLAGSLGANQDVRLRAGGDAAVNAMVGAGGNVQLDVARSLSFGGALTSNRDVRVAAGVDAVLGGTIGAVGNLAVDTGRSLSVGGVLRGNELRIGAAGDIASSGDIGALGSLNLSAGNMLVSSGALTANRDVTLRAGADAALGGNTGAGGNLLANAGRNLSLSGQLTGNNVGLGAGANLGNSGVIGAQGGLTLSAGGALSAGGTVAGARDVVLRGSGDVALNGNVGAIGNLQADAGQSLAVGGRVTGTNVLLGATRDLAVAGGIDAAGALDMAAGGTLTMTGAAASNGDASVRAAADVVLNGAIDSGGAVNAVAGRSLGAGGRLTGGNVALSAGQDISVSGVVGGQGPVNVNAIGALGIAGTVGSNGNVALRAGTDALLNGAVGALGSLQADAGRDMNLGGRIVGDNVRLASMRDTSANGDIEAQGFLDVAAGGKLAMGGTATADRDINLRGGGDTIIGGAVGANGDLRVNAGYNLTIGTSAKAQAGGALALVAGGDLSAGGIVAANGAAGLQAGRDLQVDGFASAYGGNLALSAGRNISQGGAGRMQAARDVRALANGNLALAGTTIGVGAIRLQSLTDTTLNGQLGAGGVATFDAGRSLSVGSAARIQGDGGLAAKAGLDATLGGTLSSKQGVAIEAARNVRLDGIALADGGDLRIVGGGDLLAGSAAHAQASRDVIAQAGGNLGAAGTFSALRDIALTAGGNVSADGQLAADRNVSMLAHGDVDVGAAGHVQAGGVLVADAGRNVNVAGLMGTAGTAAGGSALNARAGQDMSVTGTITAGSPMTLNAARNLSVDGIATAVGGDLDLTAGQQLTIGTAGRAQAAENLAARSGGNLAALGILAANKAVSLDATGDTRVDGTVAALGAGLAVSTGNDLSVGSTGRMQAATGLTASAGRDLAIAGAISSARDLAMQAARDVSLAGVAAGDGALSLSGRNVGIAANGVAQAGTTLRMDAAGQLNSAGKVIAEGAATLTAADTLALSGTTASTGGGLALRSVGSDVILDATARTQAEGALTVMAARDLVTRSTTSSNGSVTLTAARDLSLGGITASLGGDLRMGAGGNAYVDADGRAQAAGVLALNANGTLANDGLLAGGQVAALGSGGTLTNRGTVLAAGDVQASTPGALTNSGRFLAGMNGQGQMALAGSVALSGNVLANTGLAAAGTNVGLTANSLVLAGGTVSANRALVATTGGAIDARGANLYGGTMSLSGSALDNRGGKLTSGGDLWLGINGVLNNQSGTIAATGALSASGTQVLNQGGTLIGHDLTVSTPGNVMNAGGLMQADNTLSVSGAHIDNTDTPSSDPAHPHGIIGKTVILNAGDIDNARGTLAASDAMSINTGLLQNAAGLISSGSTADIVAGTLANQGGNVVAGTRLSVTTNAMTGTGTLQSRGDLFLTVNGSLDNTSLLAAGRDASVSVNGTLNNYSTISAGRDLTVGAVNINNQAGGQMVSGGGTTVSASQALSNAGLIDGRVTRIQGGSVTNLGRIYGDSIGVSTGYLRNDVGPAGAGVIAARGNMDLGIGTLDNVAQGLIYAMGDLRIGGGLDSNWQAIGQAQAINNHSATIQADGNANIAAVKINNINDHYASEVVQVGSGSKVYYRRNGSTDLLDGDAYWLCDQTTALCSKDWHWLEDDQERRLLLPSTTYPESRYGPPFTYSHGGHGKKGVSAPVSLAYTPPGQECVGGGGDAGCGWVDTPEQFLYTADEPVWDVFGVPRPTPLPEQASWGKNCNTVAECDAVQAAYDAAYKAYVDLYKDLDQKIRDFNADFNARLVKDFYVYDITQTVTESRTVSSDPGKIVVGGNANLSGEVVNDKSQIVAGGALNISGPSIQNIGAQGERVVEGSGQLIYTYEKNDDRKYDVAPYSGVISTQAIEQPVASYGGNSPLPSTGASAPGATGTAGTARPPIITSVALPGSGIVRTVTPPSGVPNSALYTVVPAANSPYLVVTDPRFTGQRPTVSSDYLLELLRGAGPAIGKTPTGSNAIASASGSAPVVGGHKPVAGGVNVAATPGGVNGVGGVSGAGGTGGGAAGMNAGTGLGGASGPGGSPAGNVAAAAAAAVAAANGIGSGSGGGAAGSAAGNGAPTASNPYLNATDTLKRLGDGFYEQKIVSDQIMAATGQRYVGDYTDAQTQYKDLLTAGAAFAQQYGLTVGTPLTPDQMRQLTTDMVWLVEQTTTLPDGTTQQVLVPQVYLVVQDGDLKGDGTLIAGRTVSLQASGDINNTGTIGSRDATVMVAENIRNTAAGTVQGSTVNLLARQDLDNIAALIKGDTVALQAGRDINLTTTTASSTGTNTWSTYVSGVSRIDAGSLRVDAGQDLNLTAASLSIQNDARLQAGNDINLLTLQQVQGESVVFKKKNNTELERKTDVGTSINAGGALTLVAGQDVNATAASVTAGGQLAVGAGRDINVLAGEASGSVRDEHYQKTSGSWGSSYSKHSIDTGDWTQAEGSTFTGDSAVFMAGRDVNVVGSNIGTSNNLVISADRNITIAAAQNTSSDDHYLYEKKSGFGALGGLSSGTSESTDTLDGTKVFHTGSTVGSIRGDVLMNAGGSLQVVGSNVLAREGDIALVGRDVTIASVNDTDKEKEFHELKQSGFSINFGSPVVDAIHTIDRMSHAAAEVDNPIMKALALGTSALTVANTVDGLLRDPQKGGSGAATITLNYGTNISSTTIKRESSSVVGSTVAAGNDLTIVSRGAGKDSDINVLGSSLSAGNNAILKADGDILMQAAANTYSQQTDSKHIDGSIGVGVMAGMDGKGSYGYGFIVQGSVAGSRGREDGSDLTWTNSRVTAGNILALQSGGDTSLIGATGKANQILASVGGDLLLQSLQDRSTYDSKNQNFGAGFTYCYGYCSSSAYGSYGQGKINSNLETVTQQTGLYAGDGGFQVDVKNNTTLIGSVIASSDKAVADGLNQLATGTLVTHGIHNKAEYEGYQVGVSGGYSWGGTQMVNGQSVPTQGGASAMPPVFAAAGGNASSTTESAISGGNIVIRDGEGQLALTGKTVDQTLASLSRDVSDTLNGLSPIFDKDKVQAGFDIVTTAQQQVGAFIAKRASDIAALEEKANDPKETQAERDRAALQAKALKDIYGQGTPYRRVLDALIAGVAGNVTGTSLAIVQGAAVNFLQGLAASKVKEIADSLGTGASADAARATLHAIVGCAGAAATNASCSAGALGAGASSLIASLLKLDADGMSEQQREDARSLLTSIVGGVAGAVSTDVVVSATAAATELGNNALTLSQIKQFSEEAQACSKLNNCDEVRKKYQQLSMTQQDVILSVCAQSPEACRAEYGDFVVNLSKYWDALGAVGDLEIPSGFKQDLAYYLTQTLYAAQAVGVTGFAEQLVKKYQLELSPEQIAEIAAIVGAVGSTKKGGGPKIPPKLEPFTNPPQSPVIPSGWISRPGRTEGSIIYYPPGTEPRAEGSTYIRVMPPGSTPIPGLEDGYWVSVKGGLPTNPATGRQSGNRGETHIPLPPNGMPPHR
jgi:filamentous hemagglutinin